MKITPAPAWADIPIYNFDIQSAGFPAPVTAWADAIRNADGVIIVSPEYNWTIPGGLKNAIDWTSRMKDDPFKGKPVAIQSCAGGLLGGARMQYHLRQCLTSVESVMLIRPEVFVNFSAKKFAEGSLELTDQADQGHGQAAARGVREVRAPAHRQELIMGRLDGRSAIVTGGARGIGRHYSTALAAEGAAVMIADIADGSDLAEELAGKHGRNATASMVCDVSDEAQVKALVAKTVERFGKIDILVNNAALYSQLEETEFTKIDVALWDKVMAVNVRGPFLMAKHVVPHMRAKGYGKIINIGSGSIFRGMPQMLHYTTSKGAIIAFTRSLSRAVGGSGICVNTLAPGFTLSDSVVENNPGHVQTSRDNAIQRRAIKRDGYPQDILGALVFLASTDSDFVTGQVIAVDGGAVNN